MTGATVLEITDPAEALRLFAPLIRAQPFRLSVLASNADALVADPTRYDSPRWWAVQEHTGQVTAAFMHTPPMPLHIALATPDQAQRLAEHLLESRHSLAGVGGMREPAQRFAQAWQARTGCTLRTTMELGEYDLPHPPRLRYPVPGTFRWATSTDQQLVDQWAAGFARDADGETDRGSTRRHDWSSHVRSGRLGLWECDGHPVSMCFHSAPQGGTTRISGVYTPPEHRGHGCASAVVAEVSRRCQSLGLACVLYTDLANPTSNGIYQQLGYRRIGDSITLSFA